jgi:hypothetical protein
VHVLGLVLHYLTQLLSRGPICSLNYSNAYGGATRGTAKPCFCQPPYLRFRCGVENQVKSVFDYMAVFNLDWFILAPECLLGFAYAHRMWMVSLGVSICGGLLWAYYRCVVTQLTK